MATAIDLNSAFAPPLLLHRFSVEQYHQLSEAGVLTPEDNVELLEGWIVKRMNQRPIHGFIIGLLSKFFQSKIPEGFSLRCQLPITLERSEPEPDIAIVVGEHSDYRAQHPSGLACRLIVEVADTSLEKDRLKAAIYREAQVQEYWIVNIGDRCVERYRFADSPAHEEPTIVPVDGNPSIKIGCHDFAVDLRSLFE